MTKIILIALTVLQWQGSCRSCDNTFLRWVYLISFQWLILEPFSFGVDPATHNSPSAWTGPGGVKEHTTNIKTANLLCNLHNLVVESRFLWNFNRVTSGMWYDDGEVIQRNSTNYEIRFTFCSIILLYSPRRGNFQILWLKVLFFIVHTGSFMKVYAWVMGWFLKYNMRLFRISNKRGSNRH